MDAITRSAAPIKRVIGPPGTGKTTWITNRVQELCEIYGAGVDPVLVVSLTRTAAAEAAGRIKLNPKCVTTLHAQAFHALDGPEIAEGHLKEFVTGRDDSDGGTIDLDEPSWEWGETQQSLYQRVQTLRAGLIPEDRWPLDARSWSKSWTTWKGRRGYLDFSDLIERATTDTDMAPTGPLHILVDEAQDFSAMELSLLRKWSVGCKSLTLVGDPMQALYTWRGSHPKMFQRDQAAEPPLILTQSYRVPRAIHAKACKWARQVSTWEQQDYQPRDAHGVIVYESGITVTQPDSLASLILRERAERKSVMVAASCSYMIAPLVKALKRRAEPFANPWRTKRGDWNPLGRSHGHSAADRVLALADPPTHGRYWTWSDVSRWGQHLKSDGLLVRGGKSRLKELASCPDRVEIHDLLGVFRPEPMSALWGLAFDQKDEKRLLKWYADHLLPAHWRVAEYAIKIATTHGLAALKSPPRIYVGTVHSFKGAEADVVVLMPNLSARGGQAWLGAGDRDGVIRMAYVGMTRAREKLIITGGTPPYLEL